MTLYGMLIVLTWIFISCCNILFLLKKIVIIAHLLKGCIPFEIAQTTATLTLHLHQNIIVMFCSCASLGSVNHLKKFAASQARSPWLFPFTVQFLYCCFKVIPKLLQPENIFSRKCCSKIFRLWNLGTQFLIIALFECTHSFICLFFFQSLSNF